jgi:hypothetical protein
MARSTTNRLLHVEKDQLDERRLLLNLRRTERWMVRAMRLWAQRHHRPAGQADQADPREDWRVAFLASLEPASIALRHVQMTSGGVEDALADFSAWLGVLTAAPDKVWRFHHPGCLGLDGDEALLLDLLRLVAEGDPAAGRARLQGQLPGANGRDRADRAQHCLLQAANALRQMGVAFPHRRDEGSRALH